MILNHRSDIESSKPMVTTSNHFKVTAYPLNWWEFSPFWNWRNYRGQLCGFVEMTDKNGNKYLTTTVY